MGEAKKRGTFEERQKNENFTCIICRVSKAANQRSDEHVIPETLNGYYHIDTVCKDCNSTLGSNVDSCLINYKLTEIYRFINKIPGKTGKKIPNPFREETFLVTDQGKTPVQVFINKKNNEINHRFIQEVSKEFDEKTGELKSFNISLDASEKALTQNIIKKIIARHNVDPTKLTIETKEPTIIESPLFSSQWSVDTSKFRIGLLKIAYEFAVDSIPSYFKDKQAIKISEILTKANFDEMEKLKIGHGFDQEFFKPFEPILDLEKPRHILILSPCPDGLYCFIKIDNLFHIFIQLSNKQHIAYENTIFGINDLTNRIFYKKKMTEIYYNEENEFAFYLKNEQEKLLAQQDSIFNQNGHETDQDGNSLLFNSEGHKHNLSLIQIKNQSKILQDFSLTTYIFPKHFNIYLRSKQNKRLYKTIAIRVFEVFDKL